MSRTSETAHLRRRDVLWLTAAAACLSGMARATPAEASLAPRYPLSGDAWDTFKAYDPATDPDAPFFRSRIRRAARIAPNPASQAHPTLDPRAPAASLVAAYLTLDGPDTDFNRTRYAISAESRVHVERFWQYQDIVVGWNSTGQIPNAALIDAAHRNGALCLGTMFQPDRRMFDGSDLPQTDVARRLVGLAAYFGFDGYFVNFEGYTPRDAEAVQDLIGLMKTQAVAAGLGDFHIQFYDGGTDVHDVWPGAPHADGTPRENTALRADSMMVDQGWSNYGLTHGCCSGEPLTPLRPPQDAGANYNPLAVYYGLQLYPGPGYFGLMAPEVISPNSGAKVLGGLQIYSVEDGLRKMRRARLDWLRGQTALTGPEAAELAAWTDPATRRTAWYRLHRSFWSGQSGNPAADNAPTPEQAAIYGSPDARKIYTDYVAPGEATDQLRLPITYGVANFITERSVIGTLPFVTRFNTGEGDAFFRRGRKVGSTPWFNLGIQDLLPSWAWWARPLHDTGSAGAPPLLEADYDFSDAWDGGASLKVSGALGPANATELRLFKTEVVLPQGASAGLVLKGGSGGVIRLGLSFADAPHTVEWLEVKPSAATTRDWWQWRQPLGRFAGRTLVALSLGFEGQAKTAKPFSVHIGELSLTAGPSMPVATPSGFKVSAFRQTRMSSVELRLEWAHDPLVAFYDLLAEDGAGLMWLGRIAGDRYYVEALPRRAGARTTRLHLVPTAPDGTTAQASATTSLAWTA